MKLDLKLVNLLCRRSLCFCTEQRDLKQLALSWSLQRPIAVAGRNLPVSCVNRTKNNSNSDKNYTAGISLSSLWLLTQERMSIGSLKLRRLLKNSFSLHQMRIITWRVRQYWRKELKVVKCSGCSVLKRYIFKNSSHDWEGLFVFCVYLSGL
jgi:hypothetical protein